jgi:hypothetical protein
MSVWVVTVAGRLNSVWATESGARAHVMQLHEVNGDALAVRCEQIEVRL